MTLVAKVFRLFDRLAVRLALLLSFALLPLGILAIASNYEKLQTDMRSDERALLSLTADTQAGRRALIESALTTAQVLAQPTLERLDDADACSTLMADTVRRSSVYSFAGFTGTDGMMRCVSSGDPQDFSQSTVFEQILAEPGSLVRRSEAGASSGAPVLIATRPVYDDGTLRGFLSIVISLDSFVWLRWNDDDGDTVRPILFNRLGEILSGGQVEAPQDLLPTNRSLADLARSGGGSIFEGHTAGGDRAVFAVTELVRGQLYVLGVWDPGAGPAAALGTDHWPLLVPLLMWLASIGVVFFALYYLVIRHLRRLGDQMRRFALGDRTLPPAVPEGLSFELREVHMTFCKMALLVTRDEAMLSTALAEKEESLRERTVLLKEMHHRVKNNLQLIASILNLQMRRLHDPRSRAVLRNVQDRVIGLATIHRNLYQSEHLSELRADHLIEELLRHLFAIGTESDSKVDLKSRLDRVTLPSEQLVPLSLLLTEAVTNVLKYVGKENGAARPWAEVALQARGDEITLIVRNSLGPETDTAEEDEGPDSTGLGTELITAFADQLGGELHQGRVESDGMAHWALVLTFRIATEDTEPEPGPSPETEWPEDAAV